MTRTRPCLKQTRPWWPTWPPAELYKLAIEGKREEAMALAVAKRDVFGRPCRHGRAPPVQRRDGQSWFRHRSEEQELMNFFTTSATLHQSANGPASDSPCRTRRGLSPRRHAAASAQQQNPVPVAFLCKQAMASAESHEFVKFEE